MALFGFLKKDNSKTGKKGFHEIAIKEIVKLTADTSKIVLDIPADLKKNFDFTPGQYLNFAVEINGKDEHRAYSICSGKNEPLAIAVKSVDKGTVSVWMNQNLKAGSTLFVAEPQGNFKLNSKDKKVVAVSAGSGITPIMSIAKMLEENGGELLLFYGNKSTDSIIFKTEIEQLKNTKTIHYLSQETTSDMKSGRITKESLSEEIKNNLELLKSDAFFICGPEQLIIDASETLHFFGVPSEKIHYELFTTPVLMKSEKETKVSAFDGESKVKMILDGEQVEFDLKSKGKTLLEASEIAGLDAPYSCKGGVCCSCKAKVLKGSAAMNVNFALTDEEVAQGYILTCQAHPTSEELIVSYDE